MLESIRSFLCNTCSGFWLATAAADSSSWVSVNTNQQHLVSCCTYQGHAPAQGFPVHSETLALSTWSQLTRSPELTRHWCKQIVLPFSPLYELFWEVLVHPWGQIISCAWYQALTNLISHPGLGSRSSHPTPLFLHSRFLGFALLKKSISH